jgi:hypothetical protein
VSDPRLPADPWQPGEQDLLREAQAIGSVLIDALFDAMREHALEGLYETVLALDRRDLERACLALVGQVLLGSEHFEVSVTDPVEGEPLPEDESPGHRLLWRVARLALRGFDAMVAEVEGSSDDELRQMLLGPLGDLYGASVRRRLEEGGGS